VARSSFIGAFHFGGLPEVDSLPDSILHNAAGIVTIFTPAEMGRKELYTEIPFTAVHGLQTKARIVTEAFIEYATVLDVSCQSGLSDEEKPVRSKQVSMIISEDLKRDKILITTPLIVATVAIAASQFLVGYNVAVLNAVEKVVFSGHSTAAWSFAVAAFSIGGPFGAMLCGKMADTQGRHRALMINSWTFLVGGLLQTFAFNLATITFSRFILGFASGYSTVLAPIYLGELAPPSLRGALGTLNQFAAVIGLLAANLLSFPLANADGWRELVSITVLVAAMQLAVAPYVLESPRWILNRDSSDPQAIANIQELRGYQHDHEVFNELAIYILAGDAHRGGELKSQRRVVLEMLAHPKIRYLFLSSLFLHMAQQLCGIGAIFFYSTAFFEGIIDNPLLGTTIVGVVNVVFTYVALLLMDSHGRRTLILWSSGGMFVSCITIVLSQLGYFNNITALLAVNAFVAFYEIGLGPIPFLMVAEMFDAKYVAVAMSVCSQLNWVCSFVVCVLFPSMAELLGAYSFLPFAAILAASFVFALTVMPETRGTTPEELLLRNSSIVYEPNKEGLTQRYREWRQGFEKMIA
jgi:SP family facilitated glucose transporter-like MFS transporter 3